MSIDICEVITKRELNESIGKNCTKFIHLNENYQSSDKIFDCSLKSVIIDETIKKREMN